MIMKKNNYFLAWFFTLLTTVILHTPATQACTDIRLKTQDNAIIIGRTLEFALDLKSNLRNSARGRNFQQQTPIGKPAKNWTAKYGYLHLDVLDVDMTVDGMNEAGLSFEYLYLPGETTYQDIPAGKENQAISYLNFGDWVLSNFQTVAEVRAALPEIFVFGQKIAATQNTIFPLHAAIHDASGAGIVVEFIDGKMKIYDNKIGVMTNSPTYNWHLTNLRNYLNLKPTNPQAVKADGITFAATGQGAGMVGLPGDASPPSRFVKMAIMLQTAIPATNASEAINLAQHIINNVDIPLGFIREAQNNNTFTNEYTQWTVFKDLTNKVFYYRTYGDLTLRSINLNKVNFSENAPTLKMPIAAKPFVLDMTEEFLKQKLTQKNSYGL
jgi:choloylglycine hydrolase